MTVMNRKEMNPSIGSLQSLKTTFKHHECATGFKVMSDSEELPENQIVNPDPDSSMMPGNMPTNKQESKLKTQALVCAICFTTSLFVSGSSFGETCGLMILEDGFEPTNITTYNDPSISGPTDDGMNFTRIESTGLDWLDLTITFNLSVNAVRQRIADPRDELFGLRYPTPEELQYLLLQLVYQLKVIDVVAGVEPGMAFMESFGQGLSVNGVHFVIGFHPNTNGGYIQQSVVYDCPQNETVTAQGAVATTDVSQFGGSFLVRAIP